MSAAEGAAGLLTPGDTAQDALHSATNESGTSRRSAPITCGGCYARWTAQGAAHCGGCHRTFSGLTLFDRHRSIAGEHGRCLDPATLTASDGSPVCEVRDGVWRFPEMTDEAKAARFGGAPDA